LKDSYRCIEELIFKVSRISSTKIICTILITIKIDFFQNSNLIYLRKSALSNRKPYLKKRSIRSSISYACRYNHIILDYADYSHYAIAGIASFWEQHTVSDIVFIVQKKREREREREKERERERERDKEKGKFWLRSNSVSGMQLLKCVQCVYERQS